MEGTELTKTEEKSSGGEEKSHFKKRLEAKQNKAKNLTFEKIAQNAQLGKDSVCKAWH